MVSGSIIGSREDLDKALQFWELLAADKYKEASDFDMRFEIETDPSKIRSMKLQIAMDLCLSYAGHYLQPEVSRLPEPSTMGLTWNVSIAGRPRSFAAMLMILRHRFQFNMHRPGFNGTRET